MPDRKDSEITSILLVGRGNSTTAKTHGVRLVLGSAILVLEFWLGKNSESRLKTMRAFICKITEVEDIICRINGLRKQVIELRKGPWSLAGVKLKVTHLGRWGGGGEEKGSTVLLGERVLWILCPKGFKGGVLGEVPREDLNRIFSSFPGVSFQGQGLH
uniref:Uncharacterized protein n=1 Tax=Pipistrellus kuhlii TaxID=59472 RepID=A0A7J8A789_PIPKU|nr:hypothetical protein mPipKuh1_008827 [Pipistrellus kuhlii]